MPTEAESQFNEAMLNIYRRAKAEAGYNATYFLSMVVERGGLEDSSISPAHCDGVGWLHGSLGAEATRSHRRSDDPATRMAGPLLRCRTPYRGESPSRVRVKGGAKLDHRGGGKLDHSAVGWSGGTRQCGGDVRTPGWPRAGGLSCCVRGDSSRRSAPGCGRGGSVDRAARRSAVRTRRSRSIR